MKQLRSFFILWVLLLFTQTLYAQKNTKAIILQLKKDIGYLASDELEGRRTGSEGEKKAADYIEAWYKQENIQPYKDQYQHVFPFVYGKEQVKEIQFTINGNTLKLNEDFFVLPFSRNTEIPMVSDLLPEVFEEGQIWMISLYATEEESQDAHFDFEEVMYNKAKEAAKQGAKAVLFYDNYGAKYPPAFHKHSSFETLDIPVAFLHAGAYEKYVKNHPEGIQLSMHTVIHKSEYKGINVAAYIDNKAPYTVIIGAHYDHLGYGEDGSSLHAGKEKLVHNGADDNASGTAALMQLATWIKKNKLKGYNYLFVHFSGEELGLFGSKAFVKNMNIDSASVAYMINMDMIGRLNDSTHALTIGGVGTSPAWGQFISKKHKDFKIAIDSSGVGPSDHTSFYHEGIPVLFFFTGVHTDYHKPTDDVEKINFEGEALIMQYIYNIVMQMDKLPKPKFTPTKQNTAGKVRFKVTLGIMPDYAYQEENGIRVDGVTDGKPASKAGIKAGDIITGIGEHKVKGMQSYMEALSKFKSGDTATCDILREGKQLQVIVTF